MIGHAMDRGGLKDSKNAPNSFFPKISRTGFWRFGTDMIFPDLQWTSQVCQTDSHGKRIGCKMTWLYTMNMWMYSFILKFIPAVILTVITGLLIHAIYKADRKSARLKNNASKVKTFSSKNRLGVSMALSQCRGYQTCSFYVELNCFSSHLYIFTYQPFVFSPFFSSYPMVVCTLFK